MKWDPFLDAYSEIKKERDELEAVLLEVAEDIPKTKLKKHKDKLSKFILKEGAKKNNGKS